MARTVLSPKGDGKAVGLYSPGFAVDPGRLVFVAGQVAIDGEGRVIGADDLGAQAAQVFRNLTAILAEAGCTVRDVVKFTTFLTRHEDFAAYTAWRKKHFPRLFPDGVYPPNTGVVVSGLVRPELRLEVEAIALRPGRAGGATARRKAAPARRRPARRAARRGRR